MNENLYKYSTYIFYFYSNDKGDKMENEKLKLDNTYIELPEIFYSRERPDRVKKPELIIFNDELAYKLNLDINYLKSSEGIDILSGNTVLPDTIPIAQAYAGHQFGYFTMLGDGRAVLLGEIIDSGKNRYDLQLKGSGITIFSRGGDGKACLGPMLREYIISEAMYGLNIKTTRSLAVIKTGEKVLREKELDGAVLSRISSSHIRVGTFEYAHHYGSKDNIRALADYTLKRHFKCQEFDDLCGNPYTYLLNKVVENQAQLIAKWQLVGFIHGVMNTDNVSISGETIDYGPCAFMDAYDPDTVFSSIDVSGRYAYKNQPKICAWNLKRFGKALCPIIDDDKEIAMDIVDRAIEHFFKTFYNSYFNGMLEKLGLFNQEENDRLIIDELLKIMHNNKADYTNTFYYLTCGNLNPANMEMFSTNKFNDWVKVWYDRVKRQDRSGNDIRELMKRSNPFVIPRNYRVEEVLKEAQENDNYIPIKKLLDVLKNPYDYSKVNEEYIKPPMPSACRYKTYCGT